MRDTRKSTVYFDERFEDLTEEIDDLINDHASGENTVEQINMLLVSLFNSKLRQLVVAYSQGKSKTDLVGLYQEYLDFFNAYDYEIYNSYVKNLWIACLGYLLDIDPNRMMNFKEKILASKFNDYLISTVLNQIFGDVGIMSNFFMPDPYSKLEPILQLGASSDPISIKNYLERDWYQGHAGLFWHDTHMRKRTYLGYWSFETAALVRMFGLDDSDLIGVDYYPSDLASMGQIS